MRFASEGIGAPTGEVQPLLGPESSFLVTKNVITLYIRKVLQHRLGSPGTQSQIESLLAPLPEGNRQRLLAGMQDIQAVFRTKAASPETVNIRPLQVGDLGWITHRQAVIYHVEYGWDWTYEGLVSQILGDFAAHFEKNRDDAWVAEAGDNVVGSVFLMKTSDPTVAKLRLLYVEQSARGLGVGARLVRACVGAHGR